MNERPSDDMIRLVFEHLWAKVQECPEHSDRCSCRPRSEAAQALEWAITGKFVGETVPAALARIGRARRKGWRAAERAFEIGERLKSEAIEREAAGSD